MDADTNIPPAHAPAQSVAEGPARLPYADVHEPDILLGRATRGDIACLAVKIIGFYALIQSLPTLGSIADLMINRFDAQRAMVLCIAATMYIGVGLFLILKATAVARWLLPRTAVEVARPASHDSAQLQAIALSIVGVVFCVWSVPMLVYLVATILIGNNRSAIQSDLHTRVEAHSASLLHYGLECGLGIWLFFGSSRLAIWWWSLRRTEFHDSNNDDRAAS